MRSPDFGRSRDQQPDDDANLQRALALAKVLGEPVP
jgi:hypothetical protein